VRVAERSVAAWLWSGRGWTGRGPGRGLLLARWCFRLGFPFVWSKRGARCLADACRSGVTIRSL